MSDEKVYMRMNSRRARWELINYSWDVAVCLFGDNYDLKYIRDGVETIRLRKR